MFKTRHHFDHSASRYDRYAVLQRMITQQLFQEVSPLWEGLTELDFPILDVGSGTGYFQEWARTHRGKYPIIQCDHAHRMNQIAHAYASPKTTTVTGDYQRLPFKSGVFSGAFSSLALQWSPQLAEAFSELHRVLKPKAILACSLPLSGTLEELARVREDLGHPSHILPFLDSTALETLAANTGWNTLKCETRSLDYLYPDVMTLLRSIHGIGASRTDLRDRHGRTLALGALIQRYKAAYQITTNSAIRARWVIGYALLQRQ